MEDAFKLLNKSIIRVEQPDIDFGEEEEEEEAAGIPEDDSELQRDRDVVEDDMNDGDVSISDRMDEESNIGDSQSVRAGGKKKVLKLSYEDFNSLTQLLLLHMRRKENESEALGVESEGLKRSQIVEWYLEEIGDDIESEEELLEKKTLVEKVIDRLIKVTYQ